MHRFDIHQRNNLKTGTRLAAEIPSSSPEVKAFVVIGAYVQTLSGRAKPSKFLNVEQDNLRFWLYKYEVHKHHYESSKEISEKQLLHVISLDDIQNIEQLEIELSTYVQDFSLLNTVWKFDPPLPFC